MMVDMVVVGPGQAQHSPMLADLETKVLGFSSVLRSNSVVVVVFTELQKMLESQGQKSDIASVFKQRGCEVWEIDHYPH